MRRPWRLAFILALGKYGSPSEACRVVGVGRRTVYDLRESDAVFREKWDHALMQYEAELVACVEAAPSRRYAM